MKGLLRKIKSMIRRARVSRSLPDTETYPIVQIEYLGKTANAEAIWPYGMGGRLPVDAQVFCFNIEGMEENKAGIGTTPTLRFKVNAEGEVYFGNPLTGSVTYYRSNGDIEIIGKNNKSVTLDGALNIVAINGVNITADVSITGDTEITGNVTIIGNLTATGTIAITGNMTITGTINGIDMDTHTHTMPNWPNGPGNTGGPV